MAKIVTKYESKNHDGNGYLHLDFDKIGKEKIYLEMEVMGVPANTETLWEVVSNGEKLDINDLTKGKKAEFIVLKSYAGSTKSPHIFTIEVKDISLNLLAKLDISVFAKPKITKAYWGDSSEKPIYNASVNHRFTAYMKGFGLYNIPLTIRFFLQSIKNNEDLELTDFKKDMRMITDYDLADFLVDNETLNDNRLFFLRAAPQILFDYVTNNKLAITGDIKEMVVAKAFFTISCYDQILFHGKNENELLDVVFNMSSFIVPEQVESLSPATVFDEQYFTQKYEPCRYERVYFKNGDLPEIKIFDEKEPTKKNKDGTFKNKTFHISAIVPPKGSKNIKEFKIKLDPVKTIDCSLSDQNKKLTTFSEVSKTEEAKHTRTE